MHRQEESRRTSRVRKRVTSKTGTTMKTARTKDGYKIGSVETN